MISHLAARISFAMAALIAFSTALGERNCYFDGEIKDIYGAKLKVLRLFAEANGPQNVAELKKAWGNIVEETTVRWTVAELRKTLAALFPDFEGEPIETTPSGYQLHIR